jgi:hypothetical protein
MSLFLQRQKVRCRSRWTKRLRQLERVLLAVAVLMVGLACLYSFYWLVFLGTSFTVHRFVVEGTWLHLTADEMASRSGVQEGDNLFMLSVVDVHKRLRSDPWVHTTVVRRMLPDTLWIYVEEKRPRAIVVADELVYVDASGQVIKKVGPGESKDLPVLTGVGEEWEGAGRLKSMLNIVELFGSSRLGRRLGLAEINYDPVLGYSMVTKAKPMQIVLGQTAFAERIGQIDQALSAIASRPGRIRYMIANEDGRVIVGYQA